MRNLVAVAEGLRTIRNAQEHFLAMFALECIFEQARPYDRLASDLARFDDPTGDCDTTLSRRLGDR